MWEIKRDGSIEARTNDDPTAVNMWRATNPNARDFRLDTIGAAWTSSPLADAKKGIGSGLGFCFSNDS
jgi:PhoPQ-activated pathogenicity-related protein